MDRASGDHDGVMFSVRPVVTGQGNASQIALRLVEIIGNVMRVQTPVRGTAVFLPERRLTGAHVEHPRIHLESVAGFFHGADDEAVGVQLAPAVERDISERRGRGNAGIDVARDERELALEHQVVEQHLTDLLRHRDRFGVFRQRDEIGHRDARRLAAFAADRRDHVGGLRRRLRRLLWRWLLRVGGGDQGRESDGKECPFHR